MKKTQLSTLLLSSLLLLPAASAMNRGTDSHAEHAHDHEKHDDHDHDKHDHSEHDHSEHDHSEHDHDKHDHSEHDHSEHDHDKHDHDALGSHVHGQGTLDIIIEDTTLLSSLIIPAADLVGFEYQAESDADIQAVQDALALVSLENTLWSIPAEAACQLTEVNQTHALLEKQDDHSGHDHSGHDHSGHDHSGHDHSGHDHDSEHGSHSDVQIDYFFECEKMPTLDKLTVNLFEHFESLQALQVQLVTPDGQNGLKLTPDNRDIRL